MPSKANIPPPDSAEVVECIRRAGWWQGSVIEASEVSKLVGQVSGATHWVIASQTCNLYNPDITAVPMVELIAASRIEESGFRFESALGDKPRQLHSRAVDRDGAHLVLSMQIHNRAWLRRQELAQVGPPIAALEDLPGDFSGRYKEIFSNWLARSYTRIELPDDFNHALKISGLKDKVLYKLKAYSNSLHGIFLRISPAVEANGQDEDEGNEAIPLTPSEVAHANGPYALSITVVVYDNCSQETHRAIKSLLDSIDTEKLPIDKLPEKQRGNRTKCSIADVAASQGLYIEGHEIAGIKNWTVHDLMSTLRFTDQDYLSSATETGD